MLELVFAISLRSRLVGLLSSRVCTRGETLMLAPCNSIHTFFMRDALDVAFVDAKGYVLSVYRAVAPFRLLKNSRAAFVLERRTRPQEPWVEPGQVLSLITNHAASAKAASFLRRIP